MGRRDELTALLEATTGIKVYFQPPDSTQMEYPCIVYERDRAITRFAGNFPYTNVKGYQVTVLDRDPDSEFPDLVAQLPMCRFDRFYVANKINHDVFSLFY